MGGVHVEMGQRGFEATAIARLRVPFTHVDTPPVCVLTWFCVLRLEALHEAREILQCEDRVRLSGRLLPGLNDGHAERV